MSMESYFMNFNPEQIIQDYKERAEDNANKAAEILWLSCREECPVRTGYLRDSHEVFVEPYRGDWVEFGVINMASYAIYVALGTRMTPANPWMERALANSKNNCDAALREGL